MVSALGKYLAFRAFMYGEVGDDVAHVAMARRFTIIHFRASQSRLLIISHARSTGLHTSTSNIHGPYSGAPSAALCCLLAFLAALAAAAFCFLASAFASCENNKKVSQVSSRGLRAVPFLPPLSSSSPLLLPPCSFLWAYSCRMRERIWPTSSTLALPFPLA